MDTHELFKRIVDHREAVSVCRRLDETGYATVEEAREGGYHCLLAPTRKRPGLLLHERDFEVAAAELDLDERRRERLQRLRPELKARGIALARAGHDAVSVSQCLSATLALGDEAVEIRAWHPAGSVPAFEALDGAEDSETLGYLADYLARLRLDETFRRQIAGLQRRIDETAIGYPQGWSHAAFAEAVARRAASPFADAAEAVAFLSRRLERHVLVAQSVEQTARLRGTVDLASYESTFPLARRMKRRLVALLGPTNSGKTHRALDALAAADTGAYLAPLRLLALEGQEALIERGVEASLLTGEERDLRPGARHVASTVELANFDEPVDVAVIDEVQMIHDPDRGWAWTAALVGAPARTVYVLGAPDAEATVRRIAAYLGEELEVHHLERKNELKPLRDAVPVRDVRPGDAIIAFSRRAVLEWKNILADHGIQAAVVYGALGPEVRRREAARFRSGEAPVLVATDAIGMGLNLPIGRVLFSTVVKFDGVRERELNAAELRQIAGRAGRYGHAESGWFGAVRDRDTHRRVVRIMDGPVPERRRHVAVMPSRRQLQAAATTLETESLKEVLAAFARYAIPKQSPFFMADLSNAMGIADALDRHPLSFRDKAALGFCPIDTDHAELMGAFRAWVAGHAQGRTQMPEIDRWLLDRAQGHRDLERLESYVRVLGIYAWLAQRFPDTFVGWEACVEARAQANERIISILAGRRIDRPCKRCGEPLAAGHRFPICDPCFRGRGGARADAWDDEDEVVYVARR